MLNFELEKIINNYLNSNNFKDYLPNGLQVEGKSKVKKIITGVTACEDLINRAISLKADAIIVHHGYFWKNESSVIQGIKRIRLKKLLSNNINLYSWHLPLDLHKKLGNNYCLAKRLEIKIKGKINNLVLWGELKKPLTVFQLKNFIHSKLNKKPFIYSSSNAKKYIFYVAWCTGQGQKFVDLLYNFKNIDAFITGEISEQTMHSIRENKIHFVVAGHHATEIYGIFELGNWLMNTYNLKVNFINIDNPI